MAGFILALFLMKQQAIQARNQAIQARNQAIHEYNMKQATQIQEQATQSQETANKSQQEQRNEDNFKRGKVTIENDVLSAEYASKIAEYAKKYGVSEEIMIALCWVESSFNPTATSKAGAYGLMQVMPQYSKCYDGTQALDYKNTIENIEIGCAEMKYWLLRANGDYAKALGAYNSGKLRENSYARKVLKTWRGL